MKVSDIKRVIEGYAPTYLAEDFDNVGLLIGSEDNEVTAVLLTLDVDIDVAAEAVARGANLIVSHHPVLFNPLKRITSDTPEGRLLMYLIENRISVYSAHTNLDSAGGGLNDLICALLNLSDCVPLTGEGDTGLGRVGNLPEEMTLFSLCEKLKNIFSLPFIRFSGTQENTVRRVAVCSGGGGSLLDDAMKSYADVYITGDVKYSGARTAKDAGMHIIEVGHYESEILAAELFRRIISDSLGDAVPLYTTDSNVNIFTYL